LVFVWFTGQFIYRAMSEEQISLGRFKTMERKLFFGIMTPGGILVVILVCGRGQNTAFPAAGCTPRRSSSPF